MEKKVSNSFNNRLKQVILLSIIVLVGIVLISQLSMFLPGILGAITLYIISRRLYFKLIFQKKWKKPLAAATFLVGYIIILAIPIYFTVTLVAPKVQELISNKESVMASVYSMADKLKEMTGFEILSKESTTNITEKVSAYIPSLLNSTTMIITNLFMMFFLLYFIYVEGVRIERGLHKLIPLKEKNIQMLATETKMMVKANALGIPVICVIQGVIAGIGYLIFGVEEWGLWAFLTGVFAFFPIVGTMVIWVPVCIMLYTQGHTGAAIGLGAYSAIVTGNIDYLARLSLLKRMGDVHPLITVFGVILGLNFFGFIGLVFGPLLISYFIVLIKIYINEFSDAFSQDDLLTDTIEENEAERKSKT